MLSVGASYVFLNTRLSSFWPPLFSALGFMLWFKYTWISSNEEMMDRLMKSSPRFLDALTFKSFKNIIAESSQYPSAEEGLDFGDWRVVVVMLERVL